MHGLEITNSSNKLVISSEALTYVYLGQATHVGTTFGYEVGNPEYVNPGGGSQPTYAWYTSSLTYQITIDAADIMVAFPVSQYPRNVTSITRAGNVWTITIFSGSDVVQSGPPPPDSSHLFCQTTGAIQIPIYVFGLPTVPSSAYGLALYNASGVLTADLTRQPLAIAAKFNLATIKTDVFYVGTSSTLCVLTGCDVRGDGYKLTTYPYFVKYLMKGGFYRDTGGSMSMEPYVHSKTGFFDSGSLSTFLTYNQPVLLVEMSNYL